MTAVLNNTQLSILAQNAVQNLPFLRNLTIENSSLRWIHDRAIKPQLIQFQLTATNITDFPSRAPPSSVEIFGFTKHTLTKLKISQIRQLNDKVTYYYELGSIHIHRYLNGR